MATPTVDQVYADFNPDGSPKEPIKQDIRRLLRFIQALAEASGVGAKSYPTRAAMQADLSQPNGTLGVIYADPVESNNYPTIWVWDDPNNVWVEGVDRISGVNTRADTLDAATTEAATFIQELRFDRTNVYGGGANKLYVPRTFYRKRGAVQVQLALTNPDSVNLPGWCEIQLDVSVRNWVYLDLNDSTMKVISGSPIILPEVDVARYVLIGTWHAAGWSSTFYTVEVDDPRQAVVTFQEPIIKSIADLKMLIPPFRVRQDGLIRNYLPANGRYDEFDLSAGNTRTLYYNLRTNTLVYTAADTGPFNPAIGSVVIARSRVFQVQSDHQIGGDIPGGIALNDFVAGKTPSTAKYKLGTVTFPAITESNLTAFGFTEGIRNSDPAFPWPYYGDDIPDYRPGARIFARVYLQTDTPDYFGVPRILFQTGDGTNIGGISMSLEKKLSPNAAIYSVSEFMIASPDARRYLLGSDVTNTSAIVIATGAQVAFGQGSVWWIARDDYPNEQNVPVRLRSLETTLSVSNPMPAILYATDLWTISGREQTLYPDNICEVRTQQKLFNTTLTSINATGIPLAETSLGGAIRIVPERLGSAATIEIRRYSDTTSDNPTRRYRRAVTVHTAPAVVPGTLRIACIGDSLTSNAVGIVNLIEKKLMALGMTPNFIGTLDTVGESGSSDNHTPQEGRGGIDFAQYIFKKTSYGTPLDFGQEASYLASNEGTKLLKLPHLRAATGSDPAAFVFNGYIWDMRFYLDRFNGLVPGWGDPEFVLVGLGTNDVNHDPPNISIPNIVQGLDVMIHQIRTALPNADIGIVFPTIPRAAFSDAKWGPENKDAIRAFLNFRATTMVDPKVFILPAWAHTTQDADYFVTVVSTDAATGSIVADINDELHCGPVGNHQYAEVVAAWIACRKAGV